jgi:predicted transcriptional regulator
MKISSPLKFLFLVTIILLIALIGYFGKYSPAPVKSDTETIPAEGKPREELLLRSFGNSPSYTIREENKESRFFKADVGYPEIHGLSDASTTKVNEEIKKFIDDQIKSNEPDLKRIQEVESECTADNPPASCEASFSMHGTVSALTPRYLSVGFGIFSMGILAAHPFHSGASFNYDLKNGKRLYLHDFFKADKNHLLIISKKVKADLKKQMGQYYIEDWVDEGAGPEEKNFSNFILTEKGFQFFFGDYQVSSYAAGNWVSLVPFSELSEILTDDFKAQVESERQTPERLEPARTSYRLEE